MYELQKLWRGQISPSERFIYEDSPYHHASKMHTDALNALYTMLSPDAQQQYEKVEQLAMDMQKIESEESFIQGFRLGARLILDTVMDYRGSFYSLAENYNVRR